MKHKKQLTVLLMRLSKWIIRHPFICAITASVIYYLLVLIIPCWNKELASKCIMILKIRDTGLTDLFIPVFLVLIAFHFFDRYKLFEKLETSCHLIKAEFEANIHIMNYIEKHFIKDNHSKDLLYKEIAFLRFKHFHLDRFAIDMIHIKDRCTEQDLNKNRSNTSITINLLNSWLRHHQDNKLEEAREFLKKKFKRLQHEQDQMLAVLNGLLKQNKLDEMEFQTSPVYRK